MRGIAIIRPLTILLVLSGCGNSQTTSNPDANLLPAGSVLAVEAMSQSVPLGKMVETDPTSRFTVTELRVGGDDFGPWMEVAVRGEAAESPGALPTSVAIRCASSPETGGWQAGSTVALGQEIPEGAFLEGTLNLLLPGDGRYGEAIPECTGPATIEVGSTPPVWFEVPAALVDQLNERARNYNLNLEAP